MGLLKSGLKKCYFFDMLKLFNYSQSQTGIHALSLPQPRHATCQISP